MTESTPASCDEDLFALWQRHRVSKLAPPCWVHSDVESAVEDLVARFKGHLQVATLGTSFEGRAIRLLRLGQGERKILLWTQMHGDEPSATPAVLDLVDYLLSESRAEPSSWAAQILRCFTLLIVPMLNPDGSERGARRSAQGIDINRDAVMQATPEGRLLRGLQAEHQPFLGINLHDQDRNKLVGGSGVVATKSVLAVAGDAALSVTPGRRLAMRVAAAMRSELERHIPGGVGLYDETFSPRAFGDNFTAAGTPVVLVESGGLPPARPFSFLSGLNFVGLVKGLRELTLNDAADFSTDAYRAIPPNRNGALVDVVVQGATVLVPRGRELLASRSDVAFDVHYSERALACADPDEDVSLEALRARGVGHLGSTVVELGDARHLQGVAVQDAQGLLLVPLLTVGLIGLDRLRVLKRSTLAAWARAGVGRVVCRVDAADWQDASGLIRGFEGTDLPAVELTLGDQMPSVACDVAAECEASAIQRGGALSLGSVIEAMTRTVTQSKTGTPSTDEQVARYLAETATLAVQGEASFILLQAPDENGALAVSERFTGEQLRRLQIREVWLRGRQLTAS